MEAFEVATKMKADGYEIDVHLSLDGEIVVIHDAKVDRTSNGTGAVASMTLAQLRDFDYYGAFEGKYRNVRIPTLPELYDYMKKGNLVINVEIKTDDHAVIKKLRDCAVEHKMTERVIYSSFDHFQLERMYKLDPTAQLAPLYNFNMIKPWLYTKRIHAEAVHPHYKQLIKLPRYVAECHKRGIRVHPWTVDDPEVIKQMNDLGADAIITNKPDVARDALGLK